MYQQQQFIKGSSSSSSSSNNNQYHHQSSQQQQPQQQQHQNLHQAFSSFGSSFDPFGPSLVYSSINNPNSNNSNLNHPSSSSSNNNNRGVMMQQPTQSSRSGVFHQSSSLSSNHSAMGNSAIAPPRKSRFGFTLEDETAVPGGGNVGTNGLSMLQNDFPDILNPQESTHQQNFRALFPNVNVSFNEAEGIVDDSPVAAHFLPQTPNGVDASNSPATDQFLMQFLRASQQQLQKQQSIGKESLSTGIVAGVGVGGKKS
jgi:hypothetical protein